MLELKMKPKKLVPTFTIQEFLLNTEEIFLELQNLFVFSMQCFHKPVFIRRKPQYYEVFKPGLRLPQLQRKTAKRDKKNTLEGILYIN